MAAGPESTGGRDRGVFSDGFGTETHAIDGSGREQVSQRVGVHGDPLDQAARPSLPACGRPVPLPPGRVAGVGDGQQDQGLAGGVRRPGARTTSQSRAWSRRWRPAGSSIGVKNTDKERALAALVEVLPLPEEVDRELLLRLFLAREASASTAIGDGIAIPHVRNPIVLHVDAADGHALLPGASRRLRGARWQTRARALFADLSDRAKPLADALAAVVRLAGRRSSRRS